LASGPLVPFGDRALRFALPAAADRRHLLAALRAVPGIADVVLAEDTGAVVLADGVALHSVADAVTRQLASPRARARDVVPPARHVIRVVYDGDDLAEVAAGLGVRADDVVALHAGADYEVAMLGFLPGFAYLRGLDPRLVLPRRAHPRTRVPVGSVAIAARYTGVYPLASPGGWSLLGRAVGPRLFDVQGAALALGDRVRFEPADPSEDEVVPPRLASGLPEPRGAHLEVVKAHGPALVIDRGRVGHMHEGVPHGGPMVPEALARANAAVGNAPGAAGIELYGALAVVARGGSVLVADDHGAATPLADGQSFSLATEGRTRVRYLAVRGGLDVPEVLGGRGTLLVASLGGHAGRPLHRGDRLAPTRAAAPTPTPTPAPVPTAAPAPTLIPILLGPDAEPAVLDAITRATFTVSPHSDRIGTRLDGPPLPPHSMQNARDRRSTPMVRGAVELTPSGLVVLGPDHPTTGGYPVVAVVKDGALGQLMSLPIGAAARFPLTP
jgi:KipI family sensor histidine kinase inhibitor